MRRMCVLLCLIPLLGCPEKEESKVIQIGADRTYEELGLAAYLQAAFEDKTKIKTQLRYGTTHELTEMANAGKLDYALVVSEKSIEHLKKESIPIRAECYAHEEFVMIGPWEDPLQHYNRGDAVELMRAVSRSLYRYNVAQIGSAENARHRWLMTRTGDRGDPGQFFPKKLQGVDHVVEIIDSNALGLVKRSSLLVAGSRGKLPHRLYRCNDPQLVLRLHIAEVHPGKTKRPRHPEFFDFVTGEDGKKLIKTFGKERFPLAVYGVGEPADGAGAEVPELDERMIAKRAPGADEEDAKKRTNPSEIRR